LAPAAIREALHCLNLNVSKGRVALSNIFIHFYCVRIGR
jgi:hypothetical protein